MILVMLGNIKLVDLSKLACATKLLKTLQISEVHTVPACGYYVTCATTKMMGMEGLPAILFGSEQNARGRQGLGARFSMTLPSSVTVFACTLRYENMQIFGCFCIFNVVGCMMSAVFVTVHVSSSDARGLNYSDPLKVG